jgi:hypothetical protein
MRCVSRNNLNISGLILVLLISCSAGAHNYIFAAFEDTGSGTRPAGMANAFTALSDDISAIYYNPAGLSQISWREIALDYGSLYSGMTDVSGMGKACAAYAHSLGSIGTLGLGWTDFRLDGYYSEDALTLAYAREIPTPFRKGALSAGLNLKYLNLKIGNPPYTQSYALFNGGYSRTAAALDIGFLCSLSYSHYIALTLVNVNRPEIGFETLSPIDAFSKLGYAYRTDSFNAAVDISLSGENSMTVAGGIENWSRNNNLGIRCGLTNSTLGYSGLSLGASYRFNPNFQVDYAFSCALSGISSFNASHRTSLTLKFGDKLREKNEVESNLKTLRNSLNSSQEELKNAGLQADEAIKTMQDSKGKLEELETRRRESEDKVRTLQEKLNATIEKITVKHMESGNNYLSQGKYDKAAEEFNKVLEVDPENVKAKQLAESVKGRLIEKRKGEIEGLYTAGLKAYYDGKLESAVSSWKKALEIDPDNNKIRTAAENAQKELKLKQ